LGGEYVEWVEKRGFVVFGAQGSGGAGVREVVDVVDVVLRRERVEGVMVSKDE
jgi:hypothetical protein